MSQKFAPPKLSKSSFSCPHCHALAHQDWLTLAVDSEGSSERVEARKHPSYDIVVYQSMNYVEDISPVYNLNLSKCFSCKRIVVWVHDKVAWPNNSSTITPHEDMPEEVANTFSEAASIVELSPRGAAALLRLCIEKLMPHVDAKAGNINASIGLLVKKGLDSHIQRALDVLRVIGNEAVHPGQIDLGDDKEMALQLFTLVNVIVQSLISTPKQINSMFEALPAGAKDGISKRDAKSKDAKP